MSIAHRRLAGQHLIGPKLKSPADVVQRLGAVQSQDYPGAKWAVGMRVRNATSAEIDRAFDAGEILRTHVLRPTWHFVSPADIRWMLALTGPRVKATMAYYDRKLELDDAFFRRSNAAIVRALRGGKHLTRREIGRVLERARITVGTSQRLGHIMLRPELDALICSGGLATSGRGGKQFTYALLDERVPPTPTMDRDEALLELTKRYFATRSPATPNDFAWWSGLTVTDAKRGIQIAGGTLEREIIDEVTYWSDPSAPTSKTESPIVHLLPNYDEYFIAFKDRSAIANRLKSFDLVTGGDALIAHVVVVDGQLVGGWKRALTTTTVVVELRVLAQLSSRERRAIDTAARRYADFLGLTAEIRDISSASSVSRTRSPSSNRSR